MLKIIRAVTIVTLLVVLGGSSNRHDRTSLRKELQQVSEQGVIYRFLDDQTVELEQRWSGYHRMKTLREPAAEATQQWLRERTVPLLEIDPATIDTNKYAGWYPYWSRVPLTNGFGLPLQVGDLDHNGKPEVYGIYKEQYFPDFESHIYEIDSVGNVSFLYRFSFYLASSRQFTDVDKNSLREVAYAVGNNSYFIEQGSPDSIPIHLKFQHAQYEGSGGIVTTEIVDEMDGDLLVDYIYRGSEPAGPYYTYISEYDPQLVNFQKSWKTQLWSPNGESGIGGYDVGDYDGDGKVNFLASGLWGQVWVGENTGDNSYGVSWKDSIPFVNLFYQTSGDVDGDGKREFFVCATMSDGNWTIVYEADSNDHYSPTFAFHLLSGGTLDEPTLMTRDLNGDGKPELIILSGASLFIVTSHQDNEYSLWYYKLNDAKQSIQFYDFNKDGKQDFVISKGTVKQFGLESWGDIFVAANIPVPVDDHKPPLPSEFQLSQNYPNPFNPSTTITYEIPKKSHVLVSVFDLLGREVARLAEGEQGPGTYTVSWNAANFPSGVYLCRLQAGVFSATRKMQLVR